jgi:AraC-like DNA-binding protein
MMMTTFWSQQPKKGKTQQRENMKEYHQLRILKKNFSSNSKYISQLYLTKKVHAAQKDQPRDILHCGFSD